MQQKASEAFPLPWHKRNNEGPAPYRRSEGFCHRAMIGSHQITRPWHFGGTPPLHGAKGVSLLVGAQFAMPPRAKGVGNVTWCLEGVHVVGDGGSSWMVASVAVRTDVDSTETQWSCSADDPHSNWGADRRSFVLGHPRTPLGL